MEMILSKQKSLPSFFLGAITPREVIYLFICLFINLFILFIYSFIQIDASMYF